MMRFLRNLIAALAGDRGARLGNTGRNGHLVMHPKRRQIGRLGILFKLFFVFSIILAISYFTTSTLFISIRDTVDITRDIVKVRFEVLSISQRMIDSLLSMEENQKKFVLLREDEYKKYFVAALQEYRNAIWSILWFRYDGFAVWEGLHEEFKAEFPDLAVGAELPGEVWVPQEKLNRWMEIILGARRENERVIEMGMRDLYALSEQSVKRGVAGLVVSVAVGLLGIVYLAFSVSRPLRELRRGIRAFTVSGRLDPVRVFSKDELGELAAAFNEMTLRLRDEEKMRTDFIDMLSHEIRTPLTSIRESVSLIKENVFGEVNERQKRFLDIAGDELERISNLLARLMRVSSMASQIVDISPAPVSPGEMVEDVLEKVSPSTEAKGIRLTSRAGGHIPLILGDAELLGQALLNLVGNAIKYSPRDSTVTVGLEMADGGNKVLFSVTDEGPGIPEEEQQYVFNKYYRGARTKKTTDGIGLGLSIAKTIVEAHGGDIWVTGRAGAGCTFFFTIPVGGERG